MSIIVNNGVQNILGTPGAISGVFADRPSATGVADGTLYFATDTTAIYQAVAGSWILYTGGGGGVSSVTGTAPIASSGGANPVISISQSGAATNGFLNSTDWNTFNNKIGGSGVATRVAFWIGTNQISSNTNLFWDNTNNRLGIGTATPIKTLDVNGIIQTNNGLNVSSNPSFDKTGFYNGIVNSRYLDVYAGNNLIGFYNLVGNINNKSYYEQVVGFNPNGGSVTQSSFRIASAVTPNTTTNNNNYNQLLINPTYTQLTLGSGTLRGIYYNPIINSLNTSIHIAWENTSGDIIFGNLAGSTAMTYVNTAGKLGLSYLQNDAANNTIYTLFNGSSTAGIRLNDNTQIYEFGQPNGDWYIKTTANSILLNGENCGLEAAGSNTIIGDVSDYQNSTYFGVDDYAEQLVSSSNLITTSVASPTLDRIKIQIGSTQYLLVLERA